MSNGLETTCIVQVWDKLDETKELKNPTLAQDRCGPPHDRQNTADIVEIRNKS